VYDLGPPGYGRLEGAKALIDASTALGDDNPLGHHVTNSLVIAEEDGLGRVRSKGIGIGAAGSSGTVIYEDLIRKTPSGWRNAHRAAIPRKRPLQP
jgi:hypothetical protein